MYPFFVEEGAGVVHARMFVPGSGIDEDPATGSASWPRGPGSWPTGSPTGPTAGWSTRATTWAGPAGWRSRSTSATVRRPRRESVARPSWSPVGPSISAPSWAGRRPALTLRDRHGSHPGHRRDRRRRPRPPPRRRPRGRRRSSGCPPSSCSTPVVGAHALIIRSATTVTAEVLAAGDRPDRRRPGRHRPRQRRRRRRHPRGVMVVNAPQTNIISAAEHTMALLLAQARNVPQAHAALDGRPLGAHPWEGVELADKTLGIVGLGRIGKLVAAPGRGLRHAAHRLRPVRLRRPGPADGRRAARPRPARRRVRLPHDPPAEDARDHRPDRPRPAAQGQADAAHRSTSPAAASSTRQALADAIRDGHHRRRRPRRVRHRADHRVAAVRARRGRRHPAPRGQHPRGAGQGRRHDRRHGAAGARRRVRAVRRQRRAPPRRTRRCARSCRWPSASARCSPRWSAGCRRCSRSTYEGEHRRLRHAHPHALGAQGLLRRASATSRSPT